jgi:hypothetical protein
MGFERIHTFHLGPAAHTISNTRHTRNKNGEKNHRNDLE